ncbi:hypothetical protein L7F22_028484 [Adiantum nelumboides]|nr:hypothetical protein [Adiantum nelumboides]
MHGQQQGSFQSRKRMRFQEGRADRVCSSGQLVSSWFAGAGSNKWWEEVLHVPPSDDGDGHQRDGSVIKNSLWKSKHAKVSKDLLLLYTGRTCEMVADYHRRLEEGAMRTSWKSAVRAVHANLTVKIMHARRGEVSNVMLVNLTVLCMRGEENEASIVTILVYVECRAMAGVVDESCLWYTRMRWQLALCSGNVGNLW